MWKRHKKGLIGCIISTIAIVLMLLVMVTMFEKFDIHVSGSRDMWMGLIGSIIGGMCTLFGVLITIYKQEDAEEEKKRIENMPILGFEILPYKKSEDDVDSILTYAENEMLTSAFYAMESKKFSIIKIYTLTTTVFNFVVESVFINGKIIPLSDAFSPLRCRIAPGETQKMIFDYHDCEKSIFCLIRFSYDDILGNHYYQDLPIIYDETTAYKGDRGRTRQIVEIRDVQSPLLESGKVPDLRECAIKYADYDTFCQ